MKSFRWPTGIATALLFAFLYAPLLVVVLFSFNASRFGTGWHGFTLQWYRALWENNLALDAAKNTLLLAAASTGISTVLGTMLGVGLARRFRGAGLVQRALYLPVFIPDVVLAASLLLFLGLLRRWTGWFELGLMTMVLAHVTFQIPFVAIVVRARMSGMDPSLEEAARDLGATPAQVFRHVTLPLLVPGVLAAALLAFTLSLDDFVVSFFTSGPGSTTLPILIYSSVKRGITPDINALSALLVLAAAAGTVLVTWLRRKVP
ncbi:MAG: ABC transporter permease [Verrucomicrobia bacterium]|nr:ABC transporter permease [Verrucomicrobiota bacterium]